MPRFALIRPDNSIDRIRSDVTPDVQTKANWKWLPVVDGTQPPVDPTTEVMVGPTLTVNATNVTEVFTKRALTAQELSDQKDVRVQGVDVVLFQIAFNHENRIRALETKAPVTAAQFRAAIKALL